MPRSGGNRRPLVSTATMSEVIDETVLVPPAIERTCEVSRNNGFIFPNAHEEGINEEDEDLYDVDLESPFNGNENEEDITFQYLNEGCHIH